MAASRSVVRVMALAALAAAACSGGGGGGSGGDGPPATPAGLAARAVPGEFDLVELSWSAPRTRDDVEVELRLDGGGWTRQPYRIPASSASLVLAFAPDLREGTAVAFRARTVRGDATSVWSAEAPFVRGVRPAADLALGTRYDARGFVLSVSWTRRSLVADRVRLERQLRPPSGAAGPWVELPVDADATAYDDVNPTGWIDFARCAYRVTYWAGERASEPAEVLSDPGGLAPPRDLSAVASGTDVHLSWVNASTAATRLDAWRAKAGVFDQRSWTLPPHATSVDDAGLTPGLYEYGVQAVAESGFGYLSQAARAAIVMPAASHASAYPARAVYLPKGGGVARRADGAFAVAQGTANTGTYSSLVFAPGAAGWDRFATPHAASLAVPGPLVDATGAVHAFYFEELWSGATLAPVRHVWRDGAAWRSEYVGLAPWGPTPSAAIAADGTLHVVWRLRDGKGFAYATNAGGSFVVEEVRPAGGAAVTLATPLALDAGEARLLLVESYATYPASRRMWLASRDGGSWSAAEIPGVTALPDGVGNLLAHGGALSWVYTLWSGYEYDLWLRERIAGAWGAPLKLASTGTVPGAGIGAALSSDGSRLAVVLPGDDYPATAARLVVRQGGVVTLTDLLPSSSAAQVGFGAAGKLWVLDGLVTSGGDHGAGFYALYEEP